MKKVLSLNLFLAVLGAVCVVLGFIPSFDIYSADGGLLTNVNLFVATFGGSLTAADWTNNPITFALCVGLLLAFIFTIVAVVLNLLRYKLKAMSLLAACFYVASGVLLFTSISLLQATNYNVTIGPGTYHFAMLATPIVIGVVECVLGFLSLCDSAIALTKKN